MRTIITILCLTFSGCFVFERHSIKSPCYQLYPYAFFDDSVNIPSGSILVPIRACISSTDTQYIIFRDLIGLKFNDYKSLTFAQFDSFVIKKIFNGICLNLTSTQDDTLKISSSELMDLNPDTLMSKYFKNGGYGDINDDSSVPPRNIWIAFVILFDNKYIIRQSCIGRFFSAQKAPTDEEILRRKIDVR